MTLEMLLKFSSFAQRIVCSFFIDFVFLDALVVASHRLNYPLFVELGWRILLDGIQYIFQRSIGYETKR